MDGQGALAESWINTHAPKDEGFALLLGFALDIQGRTKEAIDAFGRAINHQPRDPIPRIFLLRLLTRLGQFAAAKTACADMVRDFPQSPQAWVEAGTFYLDQGSPGQAVDCLQKGMSLFEQGQFPDPDPRHNLGVAYARCGDLAAAAATFESALAYRPTAMTYDCLASTRRDEGDLVAVEQLIGQRSKLFGLGPEPFRLRAEMAAAVCDWPQARRALACALALEPNGPHLHDLALALDSTGNAASPMHQRALQAGDLRSAPFMRLSDRQPGRGEQILSIRPLAELSIDHRTPQPFAHLGTIENGIVFCDQFYVVQDNMVSGDLVTTAPVVSQDLVVCTQNNRQALVRMPAIKAISDTAVLIGGASNYYHWVIDDLPRLASLPALPKSLPVLLNAPMAFQETSLELLGVDQSRLHAMAPASGYEFRRLVVAFNPDFPRQASGLLDVERQTASGPALAWLRRQFAPWMKATGPRRIFISRGAAQFRRLVNESEIESILLAHGFQSVRLEDLSMAEQIALFSSAEAVIGAHGAGFTNLVFAPAGCKILELHPPGRLPAYFRAIAEQLGQDHHSLDGRAVQSLPGLGRAFWHFHIDPLTFRDNLDAMGI